MLKLKKGSSSKLLLKYGRAETESIFLNIRLSLNPENGNEVILFENILA
ncbi:MAG: hypothetical protein ACM3QX_11025 [Syntrophomonadaceae bacterium]